MTRRWKAPVLLLAAIIAAGWPGMAQVKVGDDVSLNLSGNVGLGYSASYGDLDSSHGMAGSGNADLSGSYYSPQFLSFHFDPYLNESRQSSGFDSITTTSGFRASANIFSGSHFPGWVNYNRTYDGSSTYSIPGLANLHTHGNSDSFGVGWGETLPGFPSVSAAYQQGGGDFQTFGSNLDSLTHFRSFNFSSAYRIDGFGLNANYHNGTNESQLPSSLVDGVPLMSESSNQSYGFGASHALPFHGTAMAQYSSSAYDFSSQFGNNSGTVDTVNAAASMAPTNKLSLDTNVLYTDNLIGTFFQTIIGAGGSLQTNTPGWSSNSFGVDGDVVYSLTRDMRVIGRLDHRQQSLGDGTFSSDSIGGIFSYFRALFGGRFSAVQSVSRNSLSVNDQYNLGLSSSASYARSVSAWNLSGSFMYNRNQATALVVYTTDSYSFSGNAGRPIWKFYWNVNASGSKSSLGGVQGSDVNSQSYAMSLSMRRIGVSGSYSRSSGNAIQTPTGLTPTPVPLPVLPSAFVLFGGESYSIGIGGSPVRGMTFSGNFVKSTSNTLDPSFSSRNYSNMANFYMQHRFRKLNFNAGFTRLFQGFALAGVREQTVNSYYFGISRWFNFF